MAGYNHTENTNRLIRYIVEQTYHEFGLQYFQSLVRHLAEALQVQGVWVTEFLAEENKLRSLAFWLKDSYVDHYEYDLINTPCEQVVNTKTCLLVTDKVVELFPGDPDLKPLNAVSYMGYPLFDKKENVVGHLAVLHDAPFHPDREQEAICDLFVQRANAEFLRLKIEEQLLEKQHKLSALINGMNDAIVEIDSYGFITLANPMAEHLFGLSVEELMGTLVFSLLDNSSADRLKEALKKVRVDGNVPCFDSIIEEFQCIHMGGDTIPAQVSLSCYKVKDTTYLTLFLKDIKDLRHAQQRIEIMEEKSPPISSGIVSESKTIKSVMEDLIAAARSNSTVLLLGESGTGKEIFAKFTHENSLRKDKPLIKVNCAAIPSNLIESEFFGHEKGSFTGAVSRREGRFALADGGTIFLDEVGELPIEMQPKLLRVLQEGEFEPVGGERTRKVDARIIAATNRNLPEMIKSGNFREDLYYRLNVIPIHLPPLRERVEDIPILAILFIEKYSRNIGKQVQPISPSQLQLMQNYSWPGNIRELEHVIERAVIFSKNGHLDIFRFLPKDGVQGLSKSSNSCQSEDEVLTQTELDILEKDNILKALRRSSWKIAGNSGAASILGIPPSTLTSKIKSFGITKDL
ncbi:MAG TPA: sigma 54-interacting transcriptional regulator [Anditalea sp.]|nr:sigma 54-interacting transcriptional regulator [Anditalea sp.]